MKRISKRASALLSDVDLRLGRWQDTLLDVETDALIFDAPYSKKTHASQAERNDGRAVEGLAPAYSYLTPRDVREFCQSSLVAKCRGWTVSITDSELAPHWKRQMERVGRYAFAPLAIVIRGMSCRMQGDGPSSWSLWACVSRPRNKAFSTWGTLDGAHVGAREDGAGGGRGKPSWLMGALVRDYSRPGDLVCDPFAGWGATLSAALAFKRRAIGSEVDADARIEALHRLSGVQVDLFAEVA